MISQRLLSWDSAAAAAAFDHSEPLSVMSDLLRGCRYVFGGKGGFSHAWVLHSLFPQLLKGGEQVPCGIEVCVQQQKKGGSRAGKGVA